MTTTVTPLTERRHAGGYIVLDPSSGQLSALQITLLSGAGVCIAGLVLGKVSIGAKTGVGAAGVPAPAGATCSASPTVAKSAKNGVHSFVCIQPGATTTSKWRHIDPDGKIIGVATGNTAYSGGGISVFTITDTGTDPVVGETFIVTVSEAAASGKYVPYDPTSDDGRQSACAILHSEYKDATSADKLAAATTRGPVKIQRAELEWGANVTTDQHKTDAYAALDLLGIRSL